MNILQLKNKYISDKTLVRLNSDEECLEMSDNIWPKVIYASNSWPVINEIHPIAYKNNTCNMQCKKNNICDICNNAIIRYTKTKNSDDLEVGILNYNLSNNNIDKIVSYKILINRSWTPITNTFKYPNELGQHNSIYDIDMVYKDIGQLIKHVYDLTNEVESLKSLVTNNK